MGEARKAQGIVIVIMEKLLDNNNNANQLKTPTSVSNPEPSMKVLPLIREKSTKLKNKAIQRGTSTKIKILVSLT
jgi:hypothetical protein